MDTFKIGTFATYTDRDEEGKFSYTGQIVEVGREISIDIGTAILTVPRDEGDKFTVARKPKNWKERSAITTAPKPENTPARKSTTGGTKREQVEALVAANPSMTRQQHIELVVAEIGMTPAGASTYVSGARKLLRS